MENAQILQSIYLAIYCTFFFFTLAGAFFWISHLHDKKERLDNGAGLTEIEPEQEEKHPNFHNNQPVEAV